MHARDQGADRVDRPQPPPCSPFVYRRRDAVCGENEQRSDRYVFFAVDEHGAAALELTYGSADPEVADEIVQVGRRGGALDDTEARAVRKHEGLVGAEVEFEGPGDRTWAERAARLALDAFAGGAAALPKAIPASLARAATSA